MRWTVVGIAVRSAECGESGETKSFNDRNRTSCINSPVKNADIFFAVFYEICIF